MIYESQSSLFPTSFFKIFLLLFGTKANAWLLCLIIWSGKAE